MNLGGNLSLPVSSTGNNHTVLPASWSTRRMVSERKYSADVDYVSHLPGCKARLEPMFGICSSSVIGISKPV